MTSLSGAPPAGFGLEGPTDSSTTAFNSEVDRRDVFLGWCACIICGDTDPSRVHPCHIVPQDEPEIWADLKSRGWIPQGATGSPGHEPRNGMLLCSNHRAGFDGHSFFIRFSPETRKFICVNYSDYASFESFHGKAVALDARDPNAPFASLFIIHEWRVRGAHPFQPIAPSIPAEIPWQDWISSRGAFDAELGFIRNTPSPPDDSNSISQSPQYQIQPPTSGPTGELALGLNDDDVAQILAATRAQPSWKACESENTG